MLFFESVQIALKAIVSNKLRSFLTMLGIIIGVAAVISMVSIGMGVRSNVQSSIASLGSNMLIVTPGAPNTKGVRGAAGSRKTLKYEDAQAIKKHIKNIDYVSPTVSASYQIVNGHQNWNSSVMGVTPEYMGIQSLEVSAGSFITQENVDKRARVAVIGTTVATNLFGQENPIGKSIRVNNQPFRVVGLLKSKGQSSMGQDQDDTVIVPITTAMNRLMALTYVRTINVQVSSPDKMDQVEDEIEQLLRTRHKLNGKDDDFTVRNLTSLMETMTQTTTMITLLLGSIAGISLLVGGIGIMNIMMVSVTERTREIGIRKALGATFSNIMLQFLIESITVGVVGGVIGIFVGVAGAKAIAYFGNFTTVVTALPIIVSFAFSVGIGLFFGIYPARKAAKLDPIEALRYE